MAKFFCEARGKEVDWAYCYRACRKLMRLSSSGWVKCVTKNRRVPSAGSGEGRDTEGSPEQRA
jgi:hypothetical protein